MSVAKLIDQMYEAHRAMAECVSPPALIGGLALAAHQVPRGTIDVDFLVASEDADRAHEALVALGYACVYRTENVANYRRGDEGIDLLFAHRPASLRLLREARRSSFDVPVISVEGLIGFKLQALTNAPERPHDRADIDRLIELHRGKLDLAELKQYFDLFDQKALWAHHFDHE
jgi:hypothetical protein